MEWTRHRLARDARAAVREGPEGILRRQRERLAEAVAFARSASPLYRELYAGLPERVEDPRLLPVTDKTMLMARFDDWVTDPAVTRARVEEFVGDPGRVGERFQDTYLVATTSGTSGVKGLFVLDERSGMIESGLAGRAGGAVSLRTGLRMLALGARTAIVTAPDGHFSTLASTRRFQLDHPRLGRRMLVFSIHQPIPELVEQLNEFRPAVLSGFLGMLTMLAAEQEAGRLRIAPAMVIPGGETLTADLGARLSSAFGAAVRPAYAATECSFLAVGCREGWYHVSSDWAILEPVDADLQPTPPGEQSATVLLTNLVNRVQPILRYNLGDSVRQRPDPCPCGNILPAVQVQGRSSDLLSFPRELGGTVAISPMVFATAIDRLPDIRQYQLVQDHPDSLQVRIRALDAADDSVVADRVSAELDRLLIERGVRVSVVRSPEPPRQEPGGKFRRVIPYGGS